MYLTKKFRFKKNKPCQKLKRYKKREPLFMLKEKLKYISSINRNKNNKNICRWMSNHIYYAKRFDMMELYAKKLNINNIF